MRNTLLTTTRLLAALLAAGAMPCRSGADESQLVRLRPADRQSAVALVADEGWAPVPRLREVGNWLTMAEAQSTLPVGFFAGAELYFAQPRLADAGSFAVGTGFDDGASVQVVNPVFDFQASPKAYLGWRSANTGDAFQFSYWHFDQTAVIGHTNSDGSTVFVPLTNFNEPEPYFDVGDSISAANSLNYNVYDIDYLKTLPFSGGRWLVTGSIGARIADVNQSVFTRVTLADGTIPEQSDREVSFVGAGPRLTLEGRRNLGPFFSLYARGGYSLLFGTLESNILSQQFGVDGDVVRLVDNRDRTVSVTEIEVGASWAATSSLILSAGYLFQAWDGLNNNVGQSVVIDSGDYNSFNGLVARAVFSY